MVGASRKKPLNSSNLAAPNGKGGVCEAADGCYGHVRLVRFYAGGDERRGGPGNGKGEQPRVRVTVDLRQEPAVVGQHRPLNTD